MYLRRGKVIGASSPAAPSLSAHFSERGVLTEEDIRSLVAQSGNFSDAAVARMLLERGRVAPEQVRAALLAGTEGAIHELVTWVHGRFAFDPSPSIDSPIPGIDLELDAQTLLLDIFRKEDEQSRFE